MGIGIQKVLNVTHYLHVQFIRLDLIIKVIMISFMLAR